LGPANPILTVAPGPKPVPVTRQKLGGLNPLPRLPFPVKYRRMIEHAACRTSPINNGGNPFVTIWVFSKLIFYPNIPSNTFGYD
jgi:hypothetical protein